MTAQPTARELEVLAACLRHHSTKLAAHELGITDSTARNHLSRLYARLNVDCASQAALALGWLSVPEVVTSS
jgi:DNA-binding NarL/FixJ family response regulator